MQQKVMELYIHIPFCIRKCQYCDFLSFPADEDTQQAYVSALLREIAYYGPKCRDYEVISVYIGGGTPSWLQEDCIAAVMEEVRKGFRLTSDAEVTIECNPGTVTRHKFAVYRGVGINRISIGMQSADPLELKLLGRIHTPGQFFKTFELARENGFANINVDIMGSLPGQSAKSYGESLMKVLRVRPEHISAYSLIIEKGTPFYDLYKFDAVKQEAGLKTDVLPSEEEVCRMTKLTEHMLNEAGYLHYEISNFARPGYECRHNTGYWKRVNYLGLGLGAASLMENLRYANVRELDAYLNETVRIREGIWQNDLEDGSIQKLPATNLHASVEKIGRKAQMEEFMFLGLRMIRGISRDEFQQNFGMPIEAVYPDALRHLQEEELLMKREGRIYLTEKGQDLSNYALSQFLF